MCLSQGPPHVFPYLPKNNKDLKTELGCYSAWTQDRAIRVLKSGSGRQESQREM